MPSISKSRLYVSSLRQAITYLIFKDSASRLIERYTGSSMAPLSTSVAAPMALARAEEKHGSTSCHRLLKGSNGVRKKFVGKTLRIGAAEECRFPLLLGRAVKVQSPGIGWNASSILANLNIEGYRAQLRIKKI